jgi:uncharacterized protein YbjT (DUF2867 family)
MILITGPTGNIGSLLVRSLVERGTKIRVLFRDPEKEKEKRSALESRGVEVVGGDLSKTETLSGALEGVLSAFLLTPVSQQQVQLKSNFIQAARASGVRHVVHLSVAGVGSNSPLVTGKWHWESERELEASGMAWTHLRPTDLARYNTQLLLPTVRDHGAFYSTAGDGRIAMVDEIDVAAVAMAALTTPGHDGKSYTLTGPAALSYAEVAEALSMALGKPVRYVNITPAEAKDAMLKAGLPEWVADFINSLRKLESEGGASTVTDDVRLVIGRAATPYSETLRTIL